jgi:hypothetical protein
MSQLLISRLSGQVTLGSTAANMPTRVSSYDWPEAAGSDSERKTPSENAPKAVLLKGFRIRCEVS